MITRFDNREKSDYYLRVCSKVFVQEEEERNSVYSNYIELEIKSRAANKIGGTLLSCLADLKSLEFLNDAKECENVFSRFQQNIEKKVKAYFLLKFNDINCAIVDEIREKFHFSPNKKNAFKSSFN